MSEVQIAIIDQEDTQITLAVPGVQGPVGNAIPSGGTTNQVLFKSSATNYDATWGNVTSAMITDLAIVDADVSASAAIVDTKLATIATALKVSNSATTATNANTASAIVARDASGNFTAGTITAALTGAASSNVLKAGDTMTGALVVPLASAATPSLTFTGDLDTGVFSPGANQVAVATNGTRRLLIDSAGALTLDTGDATIYGVRVGRGGGAIATNTAIGASALSSNISGANNTAIGNNALRSNTTANVNTAVGDSALYSCTTGALNVAIGPETLYSNVSGGGNIAIGREALYFNTTGGNIAIGLSALKTTTTGDYNIGIGHGALLSNTTGTLNTVIGGLNTAYDNTTGSSNVVLGYLALRYNTTGSNNTCIGTSAGLNLTTGSNNTIIGNVQGTAGLADTVIIGAGTTERLRIDSSGRVGIGSNSPGAALEINAAAATSPFIAKINTAEAARIDSSGRLLVGTSTARSNFFSGTTTDPIKTQIEGAGVAGAEYGLLSLVANNNNANVRVGANIVLARSYGTTIGSNTIVVDGTNLGNVSFQGADGSSFQESARIAAFVDGTPGAGDMPGRLVFFTTPDGSTTPTERMRISSAGNTWINSSDFTTLYPGEGNAATGIFFESSGKVAISRDNTNPLVVNRKTSDGAIVSIRQDGTEEGSISVSGTTVSYNGAHLSRWSQLASGAERTEILRGSILSNLDEMCEWGEEDNEQLNRMKVSTVEGDKNVSGVFQCWDDDDDTYINDFYCAMTGDFIIRIAEGVTVERGDLLMSAGDGTAKPQDDDIIRSKTIAKVTSTNVSCTYEDGSYCVPCVLMAC